MNENVYGYIRVSTKEQNLDRQILALGEYGVHEKQLYQEKQSGKDFERPVYCRLIKKLKPGDTLVSGGFSQKRKRWISWCSICPCSTHGRGTT